MEKYDEIVMQNRLYEVSVLSRPPNTAASSHRKPASAGATRDSCRAVGQDETDTLRLFTQNNNIPLILRLVNTKDS